MTRKLCSVEGCKNSSYVRGWCSKHYARWSRHGDVQATTRQSPGTWHGVECGVAGCDGPVIARGWCQGHYARWRRTGEVASGQPLTPRREGCEIPGCTGDHVARGWCSVHYQRWVKFGDPHIISQPSSHLGISCTVCDHPSGDQPSLTQREAARVLGVAKNSIVKHRRGNHDNDPEWHARRAAWWIGELAALSEPVDNSPAKVHEVSEGEPEAWSE